MRKCKCGGKLKVLGMADIYDDLIEVECSDCGDVLVVEPDGLGMGGMEWVEAKMLSEDKEAEQLSLFEDM